MLLAISSRLAVMGFISLHLASQSSLQYVAIIIAPIFTIALMCSRDVRRFMVMFDILALILMVKNFITEKE